MADGSAGPGGIYDDFPGYRLPPDRELDEALRAALVVIDANVLLNLYRYNESTRDDLLGVLREVGDRLWVPHQVLKEFWRNRVGVLASRGSGTVQALDALSKQQRASADAIRQWAKSVAAEADFQQRLIGKIEALYAELEGGIRAQAPASSQGTGGVLSDPVLDELRDLLERKVGRQPIAADWEAAVKQGNERAARHEPPATSMPRRPTRTCPKARLVTTWSGCRQQMRGNGGISTCSWSPGMRRRTGGGGTGQNSWAHALSSLLSTRLAAAASCT